jgi:hypothetical protein
VRLKRIELCVSLAANIGKDNEEIFLSVLIGLVVSTGFA